MDSLVRCEWVPKDDAEYTKYHDNEWGAPQHDETRLFELLILEGAQAGLSWKTILRKRENFRKSYDGFNPVIIAGYNEHKVKELMSDAGIIRNELKIRAAIANAQSYLKIQDKFGSFDSYIWEFVGGKTLVSNRVSIKEIPSRSVESDRMSRDMIKHGFKFVGSTICYAFMQATGMVNDHTTACFRYKELCDLR